MLTSDERKQIQNFEKGLEDLIDLYLKEGIDPGTVRNVLQSHAGSDLEGRRVELDTADQ